MGSYSWGVCVFRSEGEEYRDRGTTGKVWKEVKREMGGGIAKVLFRKSGDKEILVYS